VPFTVTLAVRGCAAKFDIQMNSLNQPVRLEVRQQIVELAPITAGHVEQLFQLFCEIVARGEGFPQVPPLNRVVFNDVWVHPVTLVVAATVNGNLAGAYYLKPNLPGLGSHIANAGYIVGAGHRGNGIGRALVADSIERAPLAGFDAVQFNFVFADNPARSLYEEMGWRVVGTVPDGAGPGRDALIYWRQVP
jgi:GNAT superfamily N-acetyltransferase